jgi:hypothetical protein
LPFKKKLFKVVCGSVAAISLLTKKKGFVSCVGIQTLEVNRLNYSAHIKMPGVEL